MADAAGPGAGNGDRRRGAREVNATSAWLAQLVKQHNLPEKLFLIHQFTSDMVDDTQLQATPGLSMVLNADGFGGQAIKKAKYHAFTRSPSPFFHRGFKLFYREDTDLMTPRQVLGLRPPPDVVIYRVTHHDPGAPSRSAYSATRRSSSPA